ncbi:MULTISPECIES: hypothetical protein [unclassified Janthinobacterium]|uniref:hypothetical protein n=1 Tax=unclassified Janthinobacterium TaxID=2610881 RepID=UPI001614ED92|nr:MULTISPECIES: hypothetical protein [unclassified Janthinobacterium]MBB5368270.1 hypothetical protein [Janthinobacterium sp. K2C7]MBB5382193.1 hypothetical protein [Janthinobacterium sp. K2Li3]MBB5386652.1 hypothetical protein [Janthinobacterium sp. K2E3]
MKRAIAFMLLAAASTLAHAGNAQQLEDSLIHALQLKPGTNERSGYSGKAIQAYKQAGLVGRRPNQRFDYTDYYLVAKGASFLGHELVLIEEEYITQYIGCCVSPGVGVTVKVNSSTKNLAAFAKANHCTLLDPVDLNHALRDVAIQARFPKAHYASLSCRERDADRDDD